MSDRAWGMVLRRAVLQGTYQPSQDYRDAPDGAVVATSMR